MRLKVDLIVAHELGHAWGSYHDDAEDCTPGYDKGGLYIMYKYTLPGYDLNNDVSHSVTIIENIPELIAMRIFL